MNSQQLKPVVCVMNPDDIYWMENHGEISKYSGNIMTPYEAKAIEESQNVQFPEIRENVIFMLDPLEGNKYIERTESSDADIVEKRINAIIVIVSLLGGKNFKIKSERQLMLNDKKQVGVDVKVNVLKKVKLDSDTEVDLSKVLSGENRIVATAKFEGIYSDKNYYKAVALAQQYGLVNDPTINTFLSTRHPDNPNPCLSQTYMVNTCKDLKENLKVAEALKVDVKKALNVNVDVNVNTSHDERYVESFEFEVEFGPVVREPPTPPLLQIKNTDSGKKSRKWLYWVIGGVAVALAAGLIIALL